MRIHQPSPRLRDDMVGKAPLPNRDSGWFGGEQNPTSEIDRFLIGMMRDPRYAQRGRDADAYRNRIGRLWQVAYPGQRAPGSWGRDERPALSLREMKQQAGDLVVPLSAPSGDGTGGPPASPKATEEPAAVPFDKRVSGKPTNQADESAKNQSDGSVQIALGPLAIPAAEAAAAGLAALGLYGMDDDTRDTLSRSIDGALGGDPRTEGMETFPEHRPGGHIEFFPEEPTAPGIESLPDQSGLGDGFSLVFPDKTGPADGATTPPSEDRSGTLPQGTILRIEDGNGNHYNIDVSNSRRQEIEKLHGHLNRVPNEAIRRLLRMATDGGRLTTDTGANGKYSEITVSKGSVPLEDARRLFEEIIRADGGDPANVVHHGKPGDRLQVATYFLDGDGAEGKHAISFRTWSKSGTEKPTNDFSLFQRSNGETVFKIRFE
ncbi:MAG: hypothetical protein JJ878_12305 [Alphaproteobacteria bacterium]|nr:hypothetical protein [Alphaproteobacteria bacterium]MBO6863413.1 hypothetical protein [Alphaproteobacteria bacterium]